MGWIAIIFIAAANSLTGWSVLRRWQHDPDRLTHYFACIATGTALNGYIAFILAELGYFSLLTLTIAWLLLTVSAFLLNRRAASRPSYTLNYTSLLIIVWLPLAAFLFMRPHEFVRGGADAGVYVNLAVNIARTGSITIQNETVASLDPALYPNLLRELPSQTSPYYLFPAIFYDGSGSAELTPQFYHLHPVWQAVGAAIGGVQGALLINGLWAILGSLAIFLTARELFGRTVAFLTLAALTLNAMQIWFARYPTTEPLTQFMVWTGIWALSRQLMHRHDLTAASQKPIAILAGLCFGSAMLARIDMFFFLAIPVVYIAAEMLTKRSETVRVQHSAYFSVPFLLLAVHSFVHGYFLSRPYFLDTFGMVYRRLVRDWQLPLVLAVLGLGILLFVWRKVRDSAEIPRNAALLLIVPIVLLAAYSQFIRPLAAPMVYNEWVSNAVTPLMDHVNFLRLQWYFSPFGVWLSIVGICALIWRMDKKHVHHIPFLAIGLLFTALYIWKLQANHHQIYAMRRYVPVTLPFLVMSGAYIIRSFVGSLRGALYEKPRRQLVQFRVACAGLVTFVWIGSFVWLARGFVTQTDDVGSYAAIEQMAEMFEPDSIVLFNEQTAFGQGDMLGTTLHFMHGINVFTVHDMAQLDHAAFGRQLQKWNEAGRTVYWATPQDITTAYPLQNSVLQLTDSQPYSVTFDYLETDYFEKPSDLMTMAWRGEVKKVQPVTLTR